MGAMVCGFLPPADVRITITVISERYAEFIPNLYRIYDVYAGSLALLWPRREFMLLKRSELERRGGFSMTERPGVENLLLELVPITREGRTYTFLANVARPRGKPLSDPC